MVEPDSAPNISARQLGIRLRRLRDERGMTQLDVAKRAGTDRAYIARIESGSREPTLDMLRRLAAALSITLVELLDESASPVRVEDQAEAIVRQVMTTVAGVPIRYLGTVPADTLRWVAMEQSDEHVYVAREDLVGRDPALVFAVRASGDCLKELGIPSGSVVLLDRPRDSGLPRDGSIVLVMVDDEYTLKVWKPTRHGFDLRDGSGDTVRTLRFGEPFEIVGVAFFSAVRLDADRH